MASDIGCGLWFVVCGLWLDVYDFRYETTGRMWREGCHFGALGFKTKQLILLSTMQNNKQNVLTSPPRKNTLLTLVELPQVPLLVFYQGMHLLLQTLLS